MRFARLIPTFIALLAALLLSGCLTTGGEDPDIPWNTPQSWEGTPGIPGLSR